MKRLALVMAAVATVSIVTGPAAVAKPPTNWDGLTQVKSKRLDLVYLQPGADFRDLVQHWADVSVRGMSELKALSPIQP